MCKDMRDSYKSSKDMSAKSERRKSDSSMSGKDANESSNASSIVLN